jgi:heat-inducible transcriptional repressor
MAEREELGPRRSAVLRAVVTEHIRTAEPVGSEAVATRYRLRVSSATVRNDMSFLEELGYLTQPHTSAGRVPTDSGYRHYVDSLPQTGRLREPQQQAISAFFGDVVPDVEETLRGTAQLLSRLTRHAALALAPSLHESRIARIELIPVGSGSLLLLVTDTGQVEKRVIEPGPNVDESTIQRVARTVETSFSGGSLSEASAHAEALAETAEPGEREILRTVVEAIEAMDRATGGQHVIVGGAANIAGEEGFDRRETIRRVFVALEAEAELLRLLQEATERQEMTVTIGRENPMTGMREASLVVAPYSAGDRSVGTIGILGPMRMDYLVAMAAVRTVALRLSEVIAALAP